MSTQKAITAILMLRDEITRRKTERAFIFLLINRMSDPKAKTQLLKELTNAGITEETTKK